MCVCEGEKVVCIVGAAESNYSDFTDKTVSPVVQSNEWSVQ